MKYRSDKSKPIYTVYLGGGTPSAVDARYLDALFAKLDECFDMSQVEETSVECNPESASDELLSCLARNGVDRISFGLQSVNDATLRAIGRLHVFSDFVAALDRAHRHNIVNINADLMIGLPESRDDFVRSVSTVAALPVTHVSAYALELHRGTSLYAALKGKQPFDDDEQADMYDEAAELLAKQCFARYEISNFARDGRQCKHNLHYWSEGHYFAFGAAASGFTDGVRFTNPWDILDYIAAPVADLREGSSETIDSREEANEFAMLGLRLDCGISVSEFYERFGIDFWQFFSSAYSLRERGFLLCEGDRVRVPSDKFYVVNSILSELWQSSDE